jgi:hypothetical protein
VHAITFQAGGKIGKSGVRIKQEAGRRGGILKKEMKENRKSYRRLSGDWRMETYIRFKCEAETHWLCQWSWTAGSDGIGHCRPDMFLVRTHPQP